MISRSAPASAASAATSSIPGVSTTGSNSLGTVLVAGRNRVPNPAAGTTAVCGIGTRGGVIVHTVSPSRYAVTCAAPCHRGPVATPTKAEMRTRDPAARRAVSKEVHEAEAEALCGHLLTWSAAVKPSAPMSRSVRARVDRPAGHAVTPGVRVLLPSRAATPTACRYRCSGGSISPAASSPRGWDCRSRRGRGCPPSPLPTRRCVRARAGGRPDRGAAWPRRGFLRPHAAVGRVRRPGWSRWSATTNSSTRSPPSRTMSR